MCDFHSVIVRRDGLIYHDLSNSHSQMAQKAGWRENSVTSHLTNKPAFIELEWNGKGEYPKWEKLARLNNDTDYTKVQQDAAEAHYRKLQAYLQNGSHADYFDRPEYLDVVIAKLGGAVEVNGDGEASINLSSLTTAEGLTLPKEIGGSLYLYSLTTAEGLTLPEKIGGKVYLKNYIVVS